MTIHLTDQQRQALEAQQGQPLRVVDPLTNREYVLVSAETYERGPGAQGSVGPESPADYPDRSLPPAEVPMRVSVRDLETPPKVAAEIKRVCREQGLFTRRMRRSVEDELKLQYHFGGQCIGYLQTASDKIVVAAGTLDEAFDRQLACLSREERRKVIIDVPSRWDSGEISQILTPYSD